MVYYPKNMFVDTYPDGFGELYDLQEDPWEMQNLYFESQHRQTVEQLKSVLMDLLITTTRIRTTQPRTIMNEKSFLTRYHATVMPDGKMTTQHILQNNILNYL